MTKNTYKFIVSLFLGSLFSCEEIGEDERFLIKDQEEVKDEVPRKILIEEYTGQMCTSCPNGHAALDRIHNDFSANVVIVGIHANDAYGISVADGGLMTSEGNTFMNKYGVSSFPSIVINRSTAPMSEIPNWYGAVNDVYKKTIKAEITILVNAEVIVGPEGESVSITSELMTEHPVNGLNYHLMLCEDNIITYQAKASGDWDYEYSHNHVYRASINGIGGESISLNEGKITYSHSVKLDSSWNSENMYVVAVITGNSGVLQVEQCSLTKGNN